MNIPILFENTFFLAINKPAGVAVHGDGKSAEKTISDWVLEHYPDTTSFGEHIKTDSGLEIKRYGIVHRLDKYTSGVLLIAKTSEGFGYLKKQFKNRKIKKTYFAFVKGDVRGERGIISKPIGRSKDDVRKWATAPKARGEMREATTRFKVIKNASGVSLLEVWPLTGRTHQIRVHMNSVGHPVLSDPLYGNKSGDNFGFDRLALHAFRLVFEDKSGNQIEIFAPFPDDFKEAFKQIGVNEALFL